MRYLLVLPLVGLALWAQILLPISGGKAVSAGTTVTYVDFASGGFGECIFNSAPSAGNAVVCITYSGNGGTFVSACDGASGSCTGSSTYQLANGSPYTNSGGFSTWVYYTCNHTGAGTYVQLTLSGATPDYTAGIVASGNTTAGTGCNDGYAHNQATSSGTAYTTSPNTVTTTNAHDLLVGLSGNACGGAALTAGNDGQGNTYTLRADQTGVVAAETLAKSTINAYIATGTGVNCVHNMEILALK